MNFCKKVDKKLQIEKFIKKSFDFLKNGRLILEEDKILTFFSEIELIKKSRSYDLPFFAIKALRLVLNSKS